MLINGVEFTQFNSLGVNSMATKKVEKTGVYRGPDGHAVYLREGEQASEDVLKNYTLDAEASKAYGKEPERGYFGSIVDAPQDQGQRNAGPAPENRMDAPLANRSDADLAASAAKVKKA